MTTEEIEDDVPHVNDLTPLSEGDEFEPMLAFDVSGSTNDPAAPGSPVTKREVIEEVLYGVITGLEGLDSQAERERAEGRDAAEMGGVYSAAFSSRAQDLEDVNSVNFKDKMATVQWGGGTRIMSAWNLLSDHYVEEFGSRPKIRRPKLAAMFITDGEAQDSREFGEDLEQQDDFVYSVVAIVGHGPEHDATLKQYAAIAARKPNMRLLSFNSQTSGRAIAGDLLKLLGQ